MFFCTPCAEKNDWPTSLFKSFGFCEVCNKASECNSIPAYQLALPEAPVSQPKVNLDGTHATHCCSLHGCKYGDRDCPVKTGRVQQAYPCEDCPDEEDAIEEIKRLERELEHVRKVNRDRD